MTDDMGLGGYEDIHLFMAAIRLKESGTPLGKYDARGPVIVGGQYKGERALGAYQIMPGNWGSWAAQAGIPGADWRDPNAQDRVAYYKFTQYWNTYRDWSLVAIAWFAGPGRANLAQKQGLDAVGAIKDVQTGTSVYGYVDKIRSFMFRAKQDPSLLEGAVPVGAPIDPNSYFSPDLIAPDGDVPGSAPPQPRARDVLSAALSSLSHQVAGGQRRPLGERDPEGVQRLDPNELLDLNMAEEEPT